MKTLLFLSFLFFSSLSLQAEGTYSNIHFTDNEELATLYLCNYHSRQTFKNCGLTNTDSNSLINNRRTLYTSITEIDALSDIGSNDLDRLKKQSYLIDWNVYTDEYGLTLHQTNFLFGFTGLLIGFVFLFASIQIIISKKDF